MEKQTSSQPNPNNNQHIDKFLETFQKLGVDNPKILLENEWKVDELANNIRDLQKNWFENNTNFIKDIRSENKARTLGEIENKLKKQFNLTSEQIQGKDIDEIISLAKEISYKGKENILEMQNKLSEVLREKEKLEKEVIPTVQSAAQKEILNYKRDAKIADIISKFDLNVKNIDVLLPGIISSLNSRYSVEFDGNDLNLMTKMGAKIMDSQGYKALSTTEVIKNLLEEYGVLNVNKKTAEDNKPPINITKSTNTNESRTIQRPNFQQNNLNKAHDVLNRLRKLNG